jgi:HTH-type transcriptional regulator/antitoxin HipB
MRLRTPKDIGLTIRERRKALGLDQAELARRVGVSRQWIVGIEKGKGRADLSLVLRTLDALGVVLRTDDENAPQSPGAPLPSSAVRVADVLAAHRGGAGK